MSEDVYLGFENGESFEATLHSGPPGASGEAVFTTAYTGYEESLTDPSYAEQALVFAYPLIGNYGVDERRLESNAVQPELVVTREVTDSVVELCDDHDTPVLSDVDTRNVVTMIRDEGSMTCSIGETEYEALTGAQSASSVSEIEDIANRVGVDETRRYGDDGPHVALLDCGVKQSMIEGFVDRGARVTRFPNDVQPEVLLANEPDLVFVSNGPGDPQHYEHVIRLIRGVSKLKPVAGICLGQQIVAHAHGGDTEQMKFGHRGSNQPVLMEDEKVCMTTQNHSFEVSDPGSLEVVEQNVNDDSPEGLRGNGVRTVQWHPEANPGPHDTDWFFEEILDLA